MKRTRYSGLIKCKKCNKNFKSKLERGKRKYCCSTYDRLGKDACEREMIREEELDELIKLHFRRELDDYELRNEVVAIDIFKDMWIIRYKDHTETIKKPNFLQI